LLITRQSQGFYSFNDQESSKLLTTEVFVQLQ